MALHLARSFSPPGRLAETLKRRKTAG